MGKRKDQIVYDDVLAHPDEAERNTFAVARRCGLAHDVLRAIVSASDRLGTRSMGLRDWHVVEIVRP